MIAQHTLFQYRTSHSAIRYLSTAQCIASYRAKLGYDSTTHRLAPHSSSVGQRTLSQHRTSHDYISNISLHTTIGHAVLDIA
eukprot:1779224-Rhodomonas_salina.1